ncbi:hypothetical protein KHS38_03350 [Mucilaginibacter sp. Bleaf8]|uniref:hypothetical protein n=1 Tax=Mucilaginibacter sp. Bleaf8 TaxID=2834430 RepID=UPI001BCD350B|nr:hypothetical protein [Mucilaginibacter sp. Bleaf8]MBS7563430.1 hypothetical protein [Mucilaginibacter sp. Bleaf8]
MKLLNAIAGGFTAACAITALHQYIKRRDENAPRMDLLGMESITKILQKAGVASPQEDKLYYITMAGDIFSNGVYYSLAGVGKNKTWLKGSALGLAAGLGAVLLPGPMGLNKKHSNRTAETQLLSVLYYFAGGLVSSAVAKLLEKSTASKGEQVKQKVEDFL